MLEGKYDTLVATVLLLCFLDMGWSVLQTVRSYWWEYYGFKEEIDDTDIEQQQYARAVKKIRRRQKAMRKNWLRPDDDDPDTVKVKQSRNVEDDAGLETQSNADYSRQSSRTSMTSTHTLDMLSSRGRLRRNKWTSRSRPSTPIHGSDEDSPDEMSYGNTTHDSRGSATPPLSTSLDDQAFRSTAQENESEFDKDDYEGEVFKRSRLCTVHVMDRPRRPRLRRLPNIDIEDPY